MFSDFQQRLRPYGLGFLLFLVNGPAISPSIGATLPGSGLGAQTVQSTANYAQSPTINHLWHWKQFPIRVFIATHNPDEERQAKTAIAGFDQWVKATNGGVHYAIVNSPADADLTVRFITTETLPGQPGVVGETYVSARRGTIKAAAMTLATGDATPEDLQSTAAHEFGHALGIGGHSNIPGDLMYPVATRYIGYDGTRIVTPSRPVTARDLSTLRVCYPHQFG